MTPLFSNKIDESYMSLASRSNKGNVLGVAWSSPEFMQQAARQLLCIIAVLLMTACTSNVVNVDMKDEVSYSAFETSFPVSDQHNNKIKIRMSQTSGNDRQIVPAGKIIKIEGDDINGPAEVLGDVDLTYYSIGYGNDSFLIGQLPVNHGSVKEITGIFYVGLSQTDMDFSLEHQGTQYNVKGKTTELYGQVGLTYPISSSFDAIATMALSLGRNLSSTSEYDLKVNYKLAKHIGIMGGYRWLEYDYFKEDKSDIEISFRGPFVGLNVPF